MLHHNTSLIVNNFESKNLLNHKHVLTFASKKKKKNHNAIKLHVMLLLQLEAGTDSPITSLSFS